MKLLSLENFIGNPLFGDPAGRGQGRNEQIPFCLSVFLGPPPKDVLIDEPSATTGLNVDDPGPCWSENGRSARSDFLPLNAAQGLISNHLKQIGHQMKGTPTGYLFFSYY